jgi:hypothetical protein
VFAVGFDVHAEVFVMFGISEPVMFFQSVNFGLADRGDLTFVRVKRRQADRNVSIKFFVSGHFSAFCVSRAETPKPSAKLSQSSG